VGINDLAAFVFHVNREAWQFSGILTYGELRASFHEKKEETGAAGPRELSAEGYGWSVF
jgi:hypothetical protein